MQSFMIVLSLYGSKVGARYRSTLFTDLNLEITFISYIRKSVIISILLQKYLVLILNNLT